MTIRAEGWGQGRCWLKVCMNFYISPNKFWRPDIQHVTKINNNVLDAGNPVCSYHSTPK